MPHIPSVHNRSSTTPRTCIFSLVKLGSMRRAKPYIVLALFIGVLLPATLLFRRHLQKQNKINAALWALVIHKDDPSKIQTAVSELATLGAATYPQIALAFRDKDTLFDRAYNLANRKLPEPLIAYFPPRPSRAELRRAVASTLYDLGPAASRALLKEVELGLARLNDYEGMMLLRSLCWSIPDSPRAVKILSNYLAHPKPGKLLFGLTHEREVWPHVSHLAPLLVPWLHYLDTTSEAAQALGLMGTNAAFAVPLLIGLATPEVLNVFKQAFTDPSDKIRNEAALAFGALGAKALPAVDFFLSNIDRKNSSVLHHQLRALSEIGTNAIAAVPLLLELSDNHAFSILGNLNRIPTASPTGLHRTWLWRNEPQPGMMAAALALTQVDIDVVKDRIDVLVLALRANVPTAVLRSLRRFKNEIIPQLEPALHVGEPLGTLRPPFGPLGMPILRIVLAQNILTLDADNRPARTLFEAAMTDPDPTMRALAANRFYLATGDTNKALPIIAEALNHVKNGDDQALITIIDDFGPAAKSLIPQLESLLTHPDQFIRYTAGKTLHSVR
jgi:hypothetical protein